MDVTKRPISATPFRAVALLLTVALFTIGSVPAAGYAFPGTAHWVAHLTAYAMIAFFFGRGWPARPAAHIVVFVAAIGTLHEASEIISHNHAFETADALVNAFGASIGVTIQAVTKRTYTQ